MSYNKKRYNLKKEETGEASRKNYGFIAQDVKNVVDLNNISFEAVHDPKVNNPKSKEYMSLGYLDFIAPMVKAIQEQQVIIESLQSEVELLKKKLS